MRCPRAQTSRRVTSPPPLPRRKKWEKQKVLANALREQVDPPRPHPAVAERCAVILAVSVADAGAGASSAGGARLEARKRGGRAPPAWPPADHFGTFHHGGRGVLA